MLLCYIYLIIIDIIHFYFQSKRIPTQYSPAFPHCSQQYKKMQSLQAQKIEGVMVDSAVVLISLLVNHVCKKMRSEALRRNIRLHRRIALQAHHHHRHFCFLLTLNFLASHQLALIFPRAHIKLTITSILNIKTLPTLCSFIYT